MNDEELINVLWVEDDPKIIDTYPLDAERYGLFLVHFPCWDDAKAALQKDYAHYSAIILDAKCKHHRDSKDDAIVFLGHALSDIKELAKEKGEVIPWYVLSGAAEDDFTRSILEDRLKWDEDWTQSTNKVYYAKGVDNEMLYQRVRVHAERYNKLFQIHHIYKDVFDAMKEVHLEEETINMEDLLIPIQFPVQKYVKDYNDSGFKKARLLLESVFRSMIQNGILPDFGRKINFTWSSYLLCGKDAINGQKEVQYKFIGKESIMPHVLGKNLIAMSEYLPTDLHNVDKNPKNSLKYYLETVDSSPYLLKSYTMQLCDIILWYRNYLRNHQDFEENSKNWEKQNQNN